jgi:hypothetical protein
MMDACAKHRLDEEKVLWVVNKKRKSWFDFWGGRRNWVFWGEEKEDLMNKKVLGNMKDLEKKKFITFQHNLLGILVN